MINFDFNSDCCGCAACMNSCRHDAITMRADNEGFMMPIVDENKCVECGLCEKVCPHLNTTTDRSGYSLQSFKDKPSYLYYSECSERKDSASGGFGYEALKRAVDNGGVACSCVYDENLRAVHIISDRPEDLKRMQSSKYVQSDMKHCYREIKDALRMGREVVFCGTPCQTAGLHMFLGKTDTSRLTSICLICHGVPSPLVWDKWKAVVENKYGAKLVDINMRDKSYKGYSTSYVRYTLKEDSRRHATGSVSDPHTSPSSVRNVGMPTYLADPYIFLFTDNLYLRNCCYHCQYKADNNGADIIVGDYYVATEGDGNLGCSCLIAMTEKGDRFIHALDGVLKPSNYVAVGSVNSMLWSSVKKHSRRDEFFQRMKTAKEGDATLFKQYLPFRFKVKKVFNKLGLFGIARKIYGMWETYIQK